jgi:hypothetical protein
MDVPKMLPGYESNRGIEAIEDAFSLDMDLE